MKLADVVRQFDALAPPQTAEAWDNVGLLVGDPAADVTRAVLCIDYTAAVAAEAQAAGAELVVAYHPPIFKPLKRVTAGGGSALVFDAVRRGVAIYSPHTALDVAEGGTNDVLADLIGLTERRPLKPGEPKSAAMKIVTFVPATHVDAVADAMFAAGAGQIGDDTRYSRCNFRSEGTGTFFGEAGTHPALGQAGRLERVPEVKLETVMPVDRVAAVVAALMRTHPYETPAFDLVALAAPPTGGGLGRVGRFASPLPRVELFERIKAGLDIDHLLIAGPTDGLVSTAAVCAGSCGDLLDHAIAAKADVYLTGEMRHHDALRAAAAGVTVICTLHSHSERVTLRRLVPTLTATMPDVTWTVVTADVDPLRVV